MTKRQKSFKKGLLRAIHVAPLYKEVYSNDRELWEEFLQNCFGVSSSRELSINELIALKEYLNKRRIALESSFRITEAQEANIWALWREYRGTDIGLLEFIRKRVITKKEVKDIKSLSKRDASKVIAVLEKILKRKGFR